MKTYRIITPYGTQYDIDEDGCFLRYNEHHWRHPHDSWKCIGCAEQKPGGNIKRYTLAELLAMIEADTFSFVFKNQKPRFTLIDLDHGAVRIHGNTKWHGIQRAYQLADN